MLCYQVVSQSSQRLRQSPKAEETIVSKLYPTSLALGTSLDLECVNVIKIGLYH